MALDQDILTAQATIQHRRENMLISVRSLIQAGKTEEAKEIARWLRGTEQWEAVTNLFCPTTPPTCPSGHHGTWVSTSGLEWSIHCVTCVDEHIAKRQAEQAIWLEQQRLAQEEHDAFMARPYRHQPAEEVEGVLVEIGIPSRFKTATVKKIESHQESLYLTGSRGCGKTHRAAAIIREIVLDRTPKQRQSMIDNIQWVSVPDLLLEIRGSFREGADHSEEEIIQRYSACRVLVLDDLGVEKTTEWSLQTLYTIIDRRYREERQTIITSNLSLDELAEKLDDRIASRLSELCRVVVLTGPDRRVQKTR